MGIKMKNAPVYFTVTQVRFNAVLNLENYLPAIQDRMRAEHFTDYKREVLQRFALPIGGGDAEQIAAPNMLPQTRYTFGNTDGTSGFILDNNSLSFQTTDYDTFEAFSKNILNGLSILHEALKLDFTERVGLRYLDAVLPKTEKESLSDYLAPEVLGLSQKLNGQLAHSVSETVSFSSVSQLVSRVIIQNGRVGLPPELTAGAPKVNSRFTQPEGPHAILDTDAFYEQREGFDLSRLETSLSALHDEILKSFKVTVTPHAIKTWS
jgi:uncharacterized protein (TIGR04255 family)